MKLNTKLLLGVLSILVVGIALLIGTKSYFNNKEVNVASDKCYAKGGTPEVEMTFLTLGYNFSCEDK
ncbi:MULTISPECIES: hypothetical protein [Priestia]|jgi:hypothetical protein|uniref:hypothetical protein n=1 Tax=Priestia TaxID=2800373 RepID=UPI0006ABC6C7|nr:MULTISPECIES: hypothetical protein [Priestia]KOP77420.1 hypothetical protein AMS61_25155 [Bacillus sp. FJAT-21351]MBZ5482528.1 hypothetical protein [Bacillus sp. T_4]MDP9579871.1 hypothetical protein [Bacillus sp. 1751]MBD8114877.1 hypothetical protein [Priestia megaterium]MBM6602233.1 hypothetical protein [Priestia megaterium]